MFNQHYRINGYVLGIWRGFGIAFLFLPFLFFFPVPQSTYYWGLLIFQGYLIGVYDSHLFFAAARFGAGPTSRFMAATTLITVFLWWCLTPKAFLQLLDKGNIFITLLLILCGFTFCFWQMIRAEVSLKAARYLTPALFALSGMSIITKYIALGGASVWQALAYYLTVATFTSGCYNLLHYLRTETELTLRQKIREIFSFRLLKIALLLIAFSAVLITAKTMALRLAPNPGYVTALLLTSPVFVFCLNRYSKVPDNISVREGFAMIFFLLLLVLLVNGNYGIDD